MSRIAEQVKEFHEKYGIVVNDIPTAIDPRFAKARVNHIQEEVHELFDAFHGYWGEPDLVELADAFADIVYLCYGGALAHGIDLDAVLDAVHESNMTKTFANGRLHKTDTYQPPKIKELIYRG